MSTDTVVLIFFALVALALSIPKRTRPFTLVVLSAWFAKEAIIDYRADDTVRGTGDLIILAGVLANMVIHRKKYLAQIKGN